MVVNETCCPKCFTTLQFPMVREKSVSCCDSCGKELLIDIVYTDDGYFCDDVQEWIDSNDEHGFSHYNFVKSKMVDA